MSVTCTQFVYVVKSYSIGNLHTIKLVSTDHRFMGFDQVTELFWIYPNNSSFNKSYRTLFGSSCMHCVRYNRVYWVSLPQATGALSCNARLACPNTVLSRKRRREYVTRRSCALFSTYLISGPSSSLSIVHKDQMSCCDLATLSVMILILPSLAIGTWQYMATVSLQCWVSGSRLSRLFLTWGKSILSIHRCTVLRSMQTHQTSRLLWLSEKVIVTHTPANKQLYH
jgi:hypothetical protein